MKLKTTKKDKAAIIACNAFNDRLRSVIEAKDLSQRQFCIESEVSTSGLSQALLGHNYMNLYNIYKILITYRDINVSYLFDGVGKMFINEPKSEPKMARQQLRTPKKSSNAKRKKGS